MKYLAVLILSLPMSGLTAQHDLIVKLDSHLSTCDSYPLQSASYALLVDGDVCIVDALNVLQLQQLKKYCLEFDFECLEEELVITHKNYQALGYQLRCYQRSVPQQLLRPDTTGQVLRFHITLYHTADTRDTVSIELYREGESLAASAHFPLLTRPKPVGYEDARTKN